MTLAANGQTKKYDIVIYGALPLELRLRASLSRMGKSVCTYRNLPTHCGLTTGGLGQTDMAINRP